MTQEYRHNPINYFFSNKDPPDVLTLAILGWDAIPEEGPLTYLDLLYNMLIGRKEIGHPDIRVNPRPSSVVDF